MPSATCVHIHVLKPTALPQDASSYVSHNTSVLWAQAPVAVLYARGGGGLRAVAHKDSYPPRAAEFYFTL